MDKEIKSFFSIRKEELEKDNLEYMNKHGELNDILNDFCAGVLLHKPENIYYFAKDYFSGFNKQYAKFKPLVIVGPSGVGKGTLIRKLLADFPKDMALSVSHTSRNIRVNEKDGVNYHFVTKEEFQELIAVEKMLEYTETYGKYYGTSKTEITRIASEHKICVLEIDIVGAFNIEKANIDANFLFIYPPSVEALKERLEGRGTEDEEIIRLRCEHSVKEIEQANNSVLFKYKIINDELETTYLELRHLILALYEEEINEQKKK